MFCNCWAGLAVLRHTVKPITPANPNVKSSGIVQYSLSALCRVQSCPRLSCCSQIQGCFYRARQRLVYSPIKTPEIFFCSADFATPVAYTDGSLATETVFLNSVFVVHKKLLCQRGWHFKKARNMPSGDIYATAKNKGGFAVLPLIKMADL